MKWLIWPWQNVSCNSCVAFALDHCALLLWSISNHLSCVCLIWADCITLKLLVSLETVFIVCTTSSIINFWQIPFGNHKYQSRHTCFSVFYRWRFMVAIVSHSMESSYFPWSLILGWCHIHLETDWWLVGDWLAWAASNMSFLSSMLWSFLIIRHYVCPRPSSILFS